MSKGICLLAGQPDAIKVSERPPNRKSAVPPGSRAIRRLLARTSIVSKSKAPVEAIEPMDSGVNSSV